jgi:hypothetical protein
LGPLVLFAHPIKQVGPTNNENTRSVFVVETYIIEETKMGGTNPRYEKGKKYNCPWKYLPTLRYQFRETIFPFAMEPFVLRIMPFGVQQTANTN